MEDFAFNNKLTANNRTFKSSLDRIIERYSKLRYQDGGVEVDLECTETPTLERYFSESKKKLEKLDSKSLMDLREQSLGAQDITGDSRLDSTRDGEADESVFSSVSMGQLSVEDSGMNNKATGMDSSDMTQLTVSSLDQSQRNLSELQPEDQDEQLEMTLRSHSSSLVELYPSMISRLGQVWRRQQVYQAADSVLRRYRRWRRQSNRSHVNTTFDISLRNNKVDLERASSKALLREGSSSRAPNSHWSPMKVVTNLQSPGRMEGSPRREQHKPILVMDFSDPSEFLQPEAISLNETFTVSQVSSPEETHPEEQTCSYSVSPPKPYFPTARASPDPSLRSRRRLPLGVHSPHTNGYSTYASQMTAVRERPDIYGSPIRQSPSKARAMTGPSRSPHDFSRSPRSVSTSLSSPQRKPAVPLRLLCLRPQPPTAQWDQASAGRTRHGLRRHLSFDSSVLSSRGVHCSTKELDEDFVKLYHKLVCQNKSSPFHGAPCRYCAKSSEAGRFHTSSALAALALSPHSSARRKRHRELCGDGHPRSKRFRDENCAYSPGSKRHDREMLRCRLSTSELEQTHTGPSYSPSKHRGLSHSPSYHGDRSVSPSNHGGLSYSPSKYGGLSHSPSKYGGLSHSPSKYGGHSRSREENCVYSPGSRRHGREMLQRRLSTSELEQSHAGLSYSPSKPGGHAFSSKHGGLPHSLSYYGGLSHSPTHSPSKNGGHSYSPSKHGMCQRSSTHQHLAPDAHQEAWMRTRASLERRMASARSPR